MNFAAQWMQPMKTTIDSSVLWCLLKKQSGFEEWQQALWQAGNDGELLVCPVVFAEIAPAFDSATDTLKHLRRLGARWDDFKPDAAFLAGEIHTAYRQAGGLRVHVLPDFLIAAHAQVQADRLAADDRGYLRRYFPQLPLLTP